MAEAHDHTHAASLKQLVHGKVAMPQALIDRRGWGILPLCVGAFTLSLSCLAMASDVTAPIEQLDAGLLQVMKAGKETSFQQRYEILAPLVTRAVDLDGILQAGVGPAWASLPPAQQDLLKPAFQRYSIATFCLISTGSPESGSIYIRRRRPAAQ